MFSVFLAKVLYAFKLQLWRDTKERTADTFEQTASADLLKWSRKKLTDLNHQPQKKCLIPSNGHCFFHHFISLLCNIFTKNPPKGSSEDRGGCEQLCTFTSDHCRETGASHSVPCNSLTRVKDGFARCESKSVAYVSI